MNNKQSDEKRYCRRQQPHYWWRRELRLHVKHLNFCKGRAIKCLQERCRGLASFFGEDNNEQGRHVQATVWCDNWALHRAVHISLSVRECLSPNPTEPTQGSGDASVVKRNHTKRAAMLWFTIWCILATVTYRWHKLFLKFHGQRYARLATCSTGERQTCSGGKRQKAKQAVVFSEWFAPFWLLRTRRDKIYSSVFWKMQSLSQWGG